MTLFTSRVFADVTNFLKSLLNLLQYCLYFMFWSFGCEAYGILALQTRIRLAPPELKGEVFKKKCIYLAALGLSCGMRDLCCLMRDLLLWNSLAVVLCPQSSRAQDCGVQAFALRHVGS